MFADAHISSLDYLWLHRKLWSQAINLHFKKRWTCCGESTKVSVASPQTDTSPYPPPSPWFKESSRPLNNLALFCADVTRFSFQENCLKFWAGFPSSRSLRFLFLYKFPATHGNKRKQNSRSPTNVPNLFFSVVNKWWTCHWFDSFSRASKNQSWSTFWTRGCWRAPHSNLKYCDNYSLWRKTRKFATVANDSANSCGILLFHYR